MKQGRLSSLFLMFLVILCMAGCGKKESNEAEKEQETVLSANQQYILSGLENNGNGSILLGDVLYYSDRLGNDGGEEWSEAVYRKTGEQEAEKLAEFLWPKQSLIRCLAGRDGAVYYLYIEAEERGDGAAGFRVYLQKDDGAAGGAGYRTLADQEEALIPEGGTLWDAFPERLWKWFGINDGAVDEEGRVCLYSRYNILFLFDESGGLACEQEFQPVEGNGDRGIVNAGGQGCYLYQMGEEKAVIRKIDMQTGELSPEEQLPFQPEEVLAVLDGYDEGILIGTNQSLYRIKPSGAKPSEGAECLLDWGDFFIEGSSVLQACADGEGYCILVRGKSGLKQMRIEPTEAADTSGKQVVTLGTNEMYGRNDIIKELVVEFNEITPDYRIEIVELSLDDDLYKLLLKGEGPDIISLYDLCLSLPVDVLADKGVLEDLTPYFERSESISLEDMLPRVVDAGSYGGKFVNLIPLFTMEALAVRQGYAENAGWTPEEFLAYAEEHPDSTLYKKGKSRRALLEDLLAGDMEGYIDWEKRECCFNTEGFIQLLEGVKQANLSASATEDEPGYEGFLAGRYLAVETDIFMPECYADAMEYIEGYGKLVGYPTSSGEPCFLLCPFDSFGINSQSGCKEGAWAFLEYILSVDFDNREGESIACWPARISSFEKRMEENNRVRYGDSNMVVRFNYFTFENMENVPDPEITEEIKEELRFMADHLHYDGRIGRDGEYKTIILEEADAYFAGDKTAEEAAELIQNRVSLFLSE